MSIVLPLARPLLNPLGDPLRGGGLPWEDAGGGPVYTPLFESVTIDGWRADTQLDGAVTSWAGMKGNALVQNTAAQKPTRSATAINGRPGVSFDGGDILSVALNLSSYSAVRVVAALLDTSADVRIVLEYRATVASDGAFAALVNDTLAGTLCLAARGTTDIGETRSDDTHALATAKVVTWCPDTSLANGSRFIRENGTALSLTDMATGCGAGNFANDTLYVGARSGLTLPWTGVIGALVILSGNTQDAALDRVERWAGRQVGISW